MEYSISDVFQSTSFQELNTLQHFSELERTQMLTILAKSVQIPEFASYIST